MFDPRWWEAGATTAPVVQKDKMRPEAIRIHVPAAAVPNPLPGGIAGVQFLTGAALIAAAMLAVAVEVLAHGLIVHHGLTAAHRHFRRAGFAVSAGLLVIGFGAITAMIGPARPASVKQRRSATRHD